MEDVKIVIAGDFVVFDDDYSSDKISKGIAKLFNNNDLNIINLECPVTDCGAENKILKSGPNIKGSARAIAPLLKKLNIGLVTLANNHVVDYGKAGLTDTLEFCAANKIKTVGAGLNLEQAKKVFRKEIKGTKISVINFAENEWAAATADEPGFNPMDLIDNLKQISEERAVSDIVILIIHGGHEFYNLPSPRMVKQYRFYAENGADLIVGHHTHCISGYEIHNNVPIYYSLGNFLFAQKSVHQGWYTGLVLQTAIGAGREIRTTLVPVELTPDTLALQLQNAENSAQTLKAVDEYKLIIQDTNALNKHWSDYVDKRERSYLSYFSPVAYIRNSYIKAAFNKLKLLNVFVNKRGLALMLNLLRCEAHADLSKAVIKKHINRR